MSVTRTQQSRVRCVQYPPSPSPAPGVGVGVGGPPPTPIKIDKKYRPWEFTDFFCNQHRIIHKYKIISANSVKYPSFQSEKVIKLQYLVSLS